MYKTAKWLLTSGSLQEPLTLALIKKIHNSSFPFKDNLVFASTASQTRQFGHVKQEEAKYISEFAETVKELFPEEKITPWRLDSKAPENILSTDAKYNTYGYRIVAQWDEEKVKDYVPYIIGLYNEGLKEAVTNYAKVELIVTFVQTMENIHIFTDGNCRVMYLLLNMELIKHGFKPVILADPNELDHHGSEQLVQDIIDGQKAFERFHETGYPYEDCWPDEEIEDQNSHDFQHIKRTNGTIETNKQIIKNFDNIDFYKTYVHNVFKDSNQPRTLQESENLCSRLDEEVFFKMADNRHLDGRKFNNYTKISSTAFQVFCNVTNFDLLNESTKDIETKFYVFINAIREMIKEYEGHKFSFLHPKLCHLKDEEIPLEDLKSKISFDKFCYNLQKEYDNLALSKFKELILAISEPHLPVEDELLNKSEPDYSFQEELLDRSNFDYPDTVDLNAVVSKALIGAELSYHTDIAA
jgi:hypothetical protein